MRGLGRRVNRRFLRRVLGKPVHELSDWEVDLVLDVVVNARPVKPARPSAEELYRRAMLLGVDPCELAEARGMPGCSEREEAGADA